MIALRRPRLAALALLLISATTAIHAQIVPPPADDAPLVLDPLIVDTSADDDRYDSTGMGMKEAETYEAPFSNEIIFDELPPDKLESTLDEDMAAVSGASRADVAASGTRLRLRGFPTPQLRDSYSQTGVPQILSVRRSQTIQGPLVSVTGRGAPGGIQNFLTFRPRAKPQTTLELEFNDADDRSFDFESTGPLVKKKAWGRTALDWSNNHGPQEFAREHTLDLSASVTVRPTRRTSAMIQLDHQRYSGNPAPGLPEYRAAASSLIVGPYRPLALLHGYGPDAGIVRETTGTTVQLETQLTPRLSFRIAVQGMTRSLDEDRFTRGVFQLDTGTYGGVREPLHTEQPLDLVGVQADLSSRFRLLGLDHKIFLGAEQIHSAATRTQRALTTADRDTLLPANVRTFDPLAPNYYRPAYSPALYRRIITDRDEDTTYRGVTLSDRTAFAGGKLVVTAGARYSGVELDLHDRRPGAPFAEVTDKASDITWHSGANLVLIPGRVLAFANASTAFEPSTRVDARTGRIQGNETTSGFEAGVKGMISRRLNYTAFVYDVSAPGGANIHQKMKLLPLVGVDELRLGNDVATVIALKGIPTERRNHPAPERRTSLSYGPLTLGFDKNDRLDFIAAIQGDKRAELWGECPFEVAHRSADPHANIRRWLETLSLGVRSDADCFGTYLSVPGQGVSFCFELPEVDPVHWTADRVN